MLDEQPDAAPTTDTAPAEAPPLRIPGLAPGRIVMYRVFSREIPLLGQNGVGDGDLLPAMVVRVWKTTSGCVNLRVFCDGPHDAWLTSVCMGTLPGQWSWPERG